MLIEMTQAKGYVSLADGGITVAIDTNLTPELLEEGFVREIISKLQTMRKEAGFDVVDHIAVCYSGSDKVEEIFASNAASIQKDVLADSVKSGVDPEAYAKEWNINGETATLGVKKL